MPPTPAPSTTSSPTDPVAPRRRATGKAAGTKRTEKTLPKSERTRRLIISAAVKEFSSRGFDGTTIAAVARRAKVSKQLVQYHFSSKDNLFREVHAVRFRPAADWHEGVTDDPAELFADRFERRARDGNYVRFLVWEAASARNRTLPGQREREARLSQYGANLKVLQDRGLIPARLDHRMLQLAILSLATYPMAFPQITRLVVGQDSTAPDFQRRWAEFLRILGTQLLPPPGDQP